MREEGGRTSAGDDGGWESKDGKKTELRKPNIFKNKTQNRNKKSGAGDGRAEIEYVVGKRQKRRRTSMSKSTRGKIYLVGNRYKI